MGYMRLTAPEARVLISKIAIAGSSAIFRRMNSVQEEVLGIFRDSGALLSGHFILRSGLRSAHFFQCAQVCQYLDKVTRLVELLTPKLKSTEVDVVLAPAMGGLVAVSYTHLTLPTIA